jgi:hypothetical protein
MSSQEGQVGPDLQDTALHFFAKPNFRSLCLQRKNVFLLWTQPLVTPADGSDPQDHTLSWCERVSSPGLPTGNSRRHSVAGWGRLLLRLPSCSGGTTPGGSIIYVATLHGDPHDAEGITKGVSHVCNFVTSALVHTRRLWGSCLGVV